MLTKSELLEKCITEFTVIEDASGVDNPQSTVDLTADVNELLLDEKYELLSKSLNYVKDDILEFATLTSWVYADVESTLTILKSVGVIHVKEINETITKGFTPLILK